MILTPRLACIAALVPQGARLADVGTDHGKLPITLLIEGRIAHAIGSDLREGPLDHAARNAEEHGVILPLRLAAGLDGISPEECDTVTIAGMGGQTIAEILQNAPWTADGDHLLLLQPMTMIYELRQWLWAHGYAIERETLCREDRRHYVILSVRGGAEECLYPREKCAVSPALLAAPDAGAYLRRLIERETRALNGMERSENTDIARLRSQQALVRELTAALEGLK